jgi:dynein heavy chain
LQELDALEVVWELTVEWDTAWESYKTREFWTTDIKEMEDDVSSYAIIMYVM